MTGAKMRKLTDRMTDLLMAMRRGTEVYYMPYMGRFNPNAYCFRGDTLARCTVEMNGLKDRGLVEFGKTKSSGSTMIVLTHAGKTHSLTPAGEATP